MSRRDHLHRSRRSSSYAEPPFVDPEEIDEGDPTRAGLPSCVDAADLASLAAFSGYEDEPTQAPRPSQIELLARGAQDSADDPTRSAHESYVALSELADAPAFDPRGSDAGWSPEAAAAAYERGLMEDALLDGEIEQDEVTSFVDRASLVAASELDGRADDGPDSVTVFRASCVAPEALGSHGSAEDAQGEALADAASRGHYAAGIALEALFDDDEDVVSSAGYPAYAMSQGGEVSPYAPTESVASQRPHAAAPHFVREDAAPQLLPPPPEAPPAARRSTPSAYEITSSPSMRRSMHPAHALEIPAPPVPPTPAASIRRSLAPVPVPPTTGRRSMHSVHPGEPQPIPSTGRRSMHSVHPAGRSRSPPP
ncbi:MAG: hypothetical protein KF894_09775, partial [Labilithrix sp.]|nr:hypothetical protein [Labilithrix sp.]